MKRTIVLALFFAACSQNAASARLFQFNPGLIPEGENVLTVLGDGMFELSDTPSAPPNDFQFPVVTPFDVQVTGSDGAGGAKLIDFTLLRAPTTADRVNLIFGNTDSGSLLLYFDVPGLVRGAAIPDSVFDADGRVQWNAPGVIQARPTGGILAGSLEGGSLIAVPEPTSLALIGVIGTLPFIRKRMKRST